MPYTQEVSPVSHAPQDCSATTLSRSLLALFRGRANGTLEVTAPSKTASIVLRNGQLCGVFSPNSDVSVTNQLLRCGDINMKQYTQALAQDPPQGPLCDWVESTGLVNSKQMQRGRQQCFENQVRELFEWKAASYRFFEQRETFAVDPRCQPLPTAKAIVDAMRVQVPQEWTMPAGPVSLTSNGAVLIDALCAFDVGTHKVPDLIMLRAMRPLLLEGCDVDALRRALPQTKTTKTLLWILFRLGAVSPKVRVQALFRKRSQLRRRASAHELLGVPRDAGHNQRRRALRDLARDVHPDRFDQHPSLRRASSDVMNALIQAKKELNS